ncbi:MAG TPA: TadE/TadG family type IV pilus assembly protein [Dehalococcoidia bacterium]|nr:TadE/TadG family type IV pilus assembly protein [Dehalococcoidia bacterium]
MATAALRQSESAPVLHGAAAGARRAKAGRNRERGQNLVEFALVAPLFLVLIFAIVDFGMGLRAWISITNAAREGARYGAVGHTEAEIKQRVVDTSSIGLTCGAGTGTACVTVTGANGLPGNSVTVRVSHQYSLITPLSALMSMVSGGSISTRVDLTADSDMRLE